MLLRREKEEEFWAQIIHDGEFFLQHGDTIYNTRVLRLVKTQFKALVSEGWPGTRRLKIHISEPSYTLQFCADHFRQTHFQRNPDESTGLHFGPAVIFGVRITDHFQNGIPTNRTTNTSSSIPHTLPFRSPDMALVFRSPGITHVCRSPPKKQSHITNMHLLDGLFRGTQEHLPGESF